MRILKPIWRAQRSYAMRTEELDPVALVRIFLWLNRCAYSDTLEGPPKIPVMAC